MAVDGAVVGVVAQAWVGESGDESVTGDDGSVVAGGSEQLASGAHGINDGRSRGLSAVDKLVTDGDGVDGRPVTVDSGNNVVDGSRDISDIEDSLENLHAVGLGSSDDGRDGVTVSAVGADGRVAASESTEVLQDLVGGLTGAILVVWAVSETVTTSGWVRCVRRRRGSRSAIRRSVRVDNLIGHGWCSHLGSWGWGSWGLSLSGSLGQHGGGGDGGAVLVNVDNDVSNVGVVTDSHILLGVESIMGMASCSLLIADNIKGVSTRLKNGYTYYEAAQQQAGAARWPRGRE